METISDAEEMQGFLSGRAQPKEKDLVHLKSFAAVIKDKEYTIGRLAEL